MTAKRKIVISTKNSNQVELFDDLYFSRRTEILRITEDFHMVRKISNFPTSL